MSEAYDKISEILSDPENIKLISNIAQDFLKNNDSNESTSEEGVEFLNAPASEKNENRSDNDFSKISKILENITGNTDIDASISLISAIRPYMSSHRRENADTVIRLLKALKVISKSNISEIIKLLSLV